jgi:DNA polymerase-3 subunit gamma/tau
VNLLAQRPDQWNSIIGQDRAITVIQSALTSSKFLPKGLIFKGVFGVGKTTTAYVTAKALMCTGDDALGCGKCLSCEAITASGLEMHPDFLEVDAASKAGVQDARDMVSTTEESLPQLARRRVIIIDEAHRLSREAWDAFLKTLEKHSNHTNFIFVTNESDKIPKTIASRCGVVSFFPVDTEAIFGLLANIASANKIPYEELEALRIIARAAKGRVRNAVNILNMVACMGAVTKKLVLAMLEDELTDTCLKILTEIANKNQVEAVRLADEACNQASPSRIIECLFATYAKAVYTPSDAAYAHIAKTLTNIGEIRSIFIGWLVSANLSPDMVPLIVHELLNTFEMKETAKKSTIKKTPGRKFQTEQDMMSFLGGTIIE